MENYVAQHINQMNALFREKNIEETNRAIRRFWKILKELCGEDFEKPTLGQLKEAIKKYNYNEKGEVVARKNGAVITYYLKIGGIYRIFIYIIHTHFYYFQKYWNMDLVKEVEEKIKRWEKELGIEYKTYYDQVRMDLGAKQQLKYFTRADRGTITIVGNDAMANIITIIKKLEGVDFSKDVSNYNLEKEAENLYNILSEQIGKKNTEKVLSLLYEVKIGTSKYKSGHRIVLNPNLSEIEFNGKAKEKKEYITKIVLMILEVIYGLYYTYRGVLYYKDASTCLESVTIAFRGKISATDENQLEYSTTNITKQPESRSLEDYSNKLKTDALEMVLKTTYKSVFAEEFIKKEKVNAIIEACIEEYENLKKGVLTEEEIKKVEEETDTEKELRILTKKFNIKELISREMEGEVTKLDIRKIYNERKENEGKEQIKKTAE